LMEQEGRVAILTINRPDKLNALNDQVREDLLAALDSIESNDAVGVVLITGAGEKSFIAGADISEFAGRTPFDQRHAMRTPRIFDVMGTFPKPVIAMVNGFCLGGGCELAMSCDLIVASETAQFGQPETGLGIIPGAGGTQLLTRAVGKALAMDVILSGRRLSAREALQSGLVARVVAKEAWLSEAKRVAHDIAEKGPIGTRLAKESVKRAYETTLSAGVEAERRALYLSLASEDAREGLTAFTEKRKPEFKGR